MKRHVTAATVAAAVIGSASFVGFVSPVRADTCEEICSVGDPVVQAGQGAINGALHGNDATRHPSTESGGSGCANCQWSVEPVCGTTAHTVNGGDYACTGTGVGCPPNEERFNVYFRQPPDPWRLTGSECLPVSTTTARATAAQLIQDFFFHMPLPAPTPTYEPKTGALVNLPAIFDAGAQQLTQSFRLGPLTVTVTARATRWTWTFDPGVTQTFDKPGGAYPNKDVTHTYTSAGARHVEVTAVWTATYTVNGRTTSLPVVGTVTRSAGLDVIAREARSHLVAG